jgi:hypothetical protein
MLERAVAFTIAHAIELDLGQSHDDTLGRFADHLLGTELFPLNVRDLRERVEFALARRVGHRELRALALTLAELPTGVLEIPAPLLPGPDLPCTVPGEGWSSFERFFSDAQLVAFLDTVFRRALGATRRIVNGAFDPSLRELMGAVPTGLYVHAHRYAGNDARAVGLYQRGWDADTDDGGEDNVLRRHEFGSSMLFAPHGIPPMIQGGTMGSGAIQFAPVRSIVHLLLKDIIEACDAERVQRLTGRMAATGAGAV